MALGLTAIALVGCGAQAAGQGSPSTVPSPTSTAFSGPTKQFSSAALGVAFRYPASWHCGRVHTESDGMLGVLVRGPASVVVGVNVSLPYSQPAQAEFSPGGAGELAFLRGGMGHSAPGKVLASGFVVIDGLRLAECELLVGKAQLEPPTHVLGLLSGRGDHVPTVGVFLRSRPVAWPAVQPDFLALAASLRFTAPQGLK